MVILTKVPLKHLFLKCSLFFLTLFFIFYWFVQYTAVLFRYFRLLNCVSLREVKNVGCFITSARLMQLRAWVARVSRARGARCASITAPLAFQWRSCSMSNTTAVVALYLYEKRASFFLSFSCLCFRFASLFQDASRLCWRSAVVSAGAIRLISAGTLSLFFAGALLSLHSSLVLSLISALFVLRFISFAVTKFSSLHC